MMTASGSINSTTSGGLSGLVQVRRTTSTFYTSTPCGWSTQTGPTTRDTIADQAGQALLPAVVLHSRSERGGYVVQRLAPSPSEHFAKEDLRWLAGLAAMLDSADFGAGGCGNTGGPTSEPLFKPSEPLDASLPSFTEEEARWLQEIVQGTCSARGESTSNYITV